MERICIDCLRVKDKIPSNSVVEARRRWGVGGMHVKTGDVVFSEIRPDTLGGNKKKHLVVEVVGASAPEQSSELMDADAQLYLEEFMDDGIKACKLVL